jgi:hypothetical protein
MTHSIVFSAAVLAAASGGMATMAIAQTPPPAPPVTSVSGEAAGLMQGWALMAQGQSGLAESHARTILKTSPRSVPAIVLAIEAGIATNGASAGLDYYEQWVGTRSLEEPALLRRVAVGFLRREADREDSPARLDALRILAGDPGGGPDLRTIKDGPGAIRLRAALGEEAAVRAVIDELASGAANKMAAIDALGQSGAPQALPALMAQLKDPRPEVRAAAAEGLGRLGAQGGLPALRTAHQSDQSPFVRTKAAAALLKLNDTSGLTMLRELLVSDSPEGRLAGAEALADTPDGTWTDVVRGLAQSGEPTIRLAAARLIGSTDPALARAVADALAADTNLAVRELATRVQAELGGRDLARLRPLLRSADPLTRVKAAGGILAATR